MNTATAKSFLTVFTSKVGFEQERLYQLVRVADWSYCVRDTQRQYDIGRVLQRFPYPFNVLGDYYEAQYLNRKGLYEASTKLLERVYEQGPEQYKARALQTLSVKEQWQGRIGEALRFRAEAIKIGDPFTSLEAQLGVAICKSAEGDHHGAVRHIEQFLPIVKAFYGSHSLYTNYLNSLAVEYGEVGRIQEASNISRIVLASPYAFAYSEYRETGQDLALRGYRSRSSVPIIQSFPGNIVPMPQREAHEPSATSAHPAIFGPAPVQGLKEWKENKMVKEPNGDDKDAENLDEMEEKDLIVKLMYLTTQEGKNVNRLRKLVAYAIKVFSEPED
ncbi:MAG: hypothetical protein ACLGJB_03820 [Blastocatellia bacterium]